jgi:hypothetical protein
MSISTSVKPCCSATTKKGTQCKRKPEISGMCDMHYEMNLRQSMSMHDRCMAIGCKAMRVKGFDGFCALHYLVRAPPPASGGAGAGAGAEAEDDVDVNAPNDITKAEAFRVLEMAPTTDATAIKEKYREFLKRPEIRMAFTCTEVNEETRSARATFEKINAAYEFLKSNV